MNPEKLEEFRLVMEKAGLRPENVISDGKLHLCGSAEKERGKYCAYILHADPPVSGDWKNFQTGESGWWISPEFHTLSHDDRMRAIARHDLNREVLNREEEMVHTERRKQALRIFEAASKPPPDHPYLVRRDIPPLGDIRMARDGRLVIPVHDPKGHLHSLQFISGEGEKRFLSGGAIQGYFFRIPGDDDEALCIVEDYASGASIHLATGKTVWAALDSRNLIAVAQNARFCHSSREIILCLAADHGCNASRGRSPDINQLRTT